MDFFWSLGSKGIKGNEKAYELAPLSSSNTENSCTQFGQLLDCQYHRVGIASNGHEANLKLLHNLRDLKKKIQASEFILDQQIEEETSKEHSIADYWAMLQ